MARAFEARKPSLEITFSNKAIPFHPLQTDLLTGDQEFEHMIPWRAILIQNTTKISTEYFVDSYISSDEKYKKTSWN